MAHEAELVVKHRAELGEGPIWDPSRGVLFWLDIINGQVHVYDPGANTDRTIQLACKPTAVVVRKAGGLVIATDQGFGALDPDTGAYEPWTDPEADLPDNRFNDGKCDPAGRFWAGTMQNEGRGAVGAMYCLDIDRSVRKVFDGVQISNGICWSLDAATMYYIDTRSGGVDAFDYDIDSGEVSGRRRVVEIAADGGGPDGMTIDTDGHLWVAQWGSSGVYQYDPNSGKLLDKVNVPASSTSACWFGGADLDELYITTAQENMSEAQRAAEPLAGCLFVARPGARGMPAFEYGG